MLPSRDEVEQAVTYALRYDCPFTLLIHPWIKGTKGLVYVGRVRTVDVYDYRLDLSSDVGWIERWPIWPTSWPGSPDSTSLSRRLPADPSS